MTLEWAAEQPTEITTELINRELLPTATNQERAVQNLEFVLQQLQTALMALTSYEANDIVANSRKKNPLAAWRRLQPEELELASMRGCAPGSRDVRGGEVWFKNT